MLIHKSFWLTTIMLSIQLTLLASTSSAGAPLSFQLEEPLPSPLQHDMPILDHKKMKQRDDQNYVTSNQNQTPYQVQAKPVIKFAEAQYTHMTPNEWEFFSTKEKNDKSIAIWRLRISSAKALTLSFGFTQFFMPEGGKLFIYSPDNKQLIGPFTEKDNVESMQLWTPIIQGDTAIIELNIPTDALAQLSLVLTQVNHGYIGRSIQDIISSSSNQNIVSTETRQTDILTKSGDTSCFIDVACETSQDLQAQVRSVARLVISGQYVCSGVALNNTAFDNRPLLLTAAHCNINAESAQQIVAYWNFEHSICRSPNTELNEQVGDGPLNQTSQGSVLRALHQPVDMALIEFSQPFDPDFNVYLAGWDRANFESANSYSIHHPKGREKRVSQSSNFTTLDGIYHRVVWSSGSTTDGSSGAPLFNEQQLVIGQLFGGTANCENEGFDLFSRFDLSWSGGGSNDSGLSTWLDPNNTGAFSIDGKDANTSSGGQINLISDLTNNTARQNSSGEGGGSCWYMMTINILLLLVMATTHAQHRMTSHFL